MANPFDTEVVNPLQALLLGQQSYSQGIESNKRAAQEQALRDAGQMIGAGDRQGAIAKLLGAGNWQGANSVSAMDQNAWQREHAAAQDAESKRRFGLEYGLRQRQAANSEDYTPEEINQRRSTQLRAAGVDPASPSGQAFMLNGQYDPTVGQPKPRNLSVGDITKLSEEGGKLQQVNRFTETFNPDFAGRPVLGEARNYVGRTLPTWAVDPKAAEGATWWQDYDKYKSVVRNELYGSALTPGERADFAKADINPGMNPDAIKRNLKIQQDIVRKGIERKASAMTNEGYSPESIKRAYGLDQPSTVGGGSTQNDPLGIR